jgi:hypothetical protein
VCVIIGVILVVVVIAHSVTVALKSAACGEPQDNGCHSSVVRACSIALFLCLAHIAPAEALAGGQQDDVAGWHSYPDLAGGITQASCPEPDARCVLLPSALLLCIQCFWVTTCNIFSLRVTKHFAKNRSVGT